MKTPFYDTVKAQQAFVYESLTWLDTRFRTNSRAKGRFVDCHNLQAEIHKTTGALPENFEVPRGTANVKGMLQVARMSGWLATQPQFQCIWAPADKCAIPPLMIGDLLTGKCHNREYHIAGYLGQVGDQHEAIISCFEGRGVIMANLLDPTWRDALVAVWRVVQ